MRHDPDLAATLSSGSAGIAARMPNIAGCRRCRRLNDSLMLVRVAFRFSVTPTVLAFLLVISQVGNGQVIAPAGVRPGFLATGCAGCSEVSIASPTYGRHAEFSMLHSRRAHILVGLIGGLVVGASTGAIIGNQSAKRCHAESCQVAAALGGGADVLFGGLAGAVVGGVVGAVWPTGQ